MKWPFVLRALYEASEADVARLASEKILEREESTKQYVLLSAAMSRLTDVMDQAQARHEQEMVRAEARYADLMVSYRMLRLQGAAAVDVPRETKQAEKPDPVIQAVNRASRGDPDLRRRMLAQIDIDRQAKPGITDVELVMRIERGTKPQEELDS